MAKRRKSRKMDDFGYGDMTKALTGTIAFGTTALVGTNIINALKR